ncbi:DEXDc_RapA domain containing protein [Candidatus Nanopelagicaceae bacterium]
MSLINNRDKTLQEALKNSLGSADRVDIQAGFFFFSGFSSLAEELKDKKIRILVGLELDPKCIPEINNQSKNGDVDLTAYQVRGSTGGALALQSNYEEALVGLINDSDTFENDSVDKAYEIFISKVLDGTLEIKKTIAKEHGKFYLLKNKPMHSHGGDLPGTAFMGSANFTFNGLVGQGELMQVFHDKPDFEQYQLEFDGNWSSAKSISIVDAHNRTEFVERISKKIWKHQTPKPYEVYIRVLHEIFASQDSVSVLTPSKITNGEYWDLEYQIDAIKMGIDRINTHNGVIIADVTGLGKSIIASAIAKNLEIQTVVISPPHLIPQWEDYQEVFRLPGARIYSIGKMQEVYDRYISWSEPLLFIIDEAHRFRNEDTDDYRLLHQLCRTNPANKVIALTATPFNNAPKDMFAIVKLFQTPGNSTLKSVDNLSLRFRELIERYRKLRKDMKTMEAILIEKEADEIAAEQRRLVEAVVLRRSRIDLQNVTRYREDLERQNIRFPEVIGPELLEYELGELFDLYVFTLESLVNSDDPNAYVGARYKPSAYLSDREAFLKKFGDLFEGRDLVVGQKNNADNMRRLLVTRFESSKFAFETTLNRMITVNEKVIRWWHEKEMVPIQKKGDLMDPDDYFDTESVDLDPTEMGGLDGPVDQPLNAKGLIVVPKSMFEEKFISDVERDTSLLKEIQDRWFGQDSFAGLDPKTDHLVTELKRLQQEMPSRKIVIFSSFADTVNYLARELSVRGVDRIFKYTAADASTSVRKLIKENFDASEKAARQKDDFDVLVATDALSEGYNLHRAGVIINYDIPYNPTRVIQRVGRINRIDKLVYEKIHIFNFFPTSIGEKETGLKRISTLKIRLINAIVGSDHKTLTDTEELKSFFKDEFQSEQEKIDKGNWDSVAREDYEIARRNQDLMDEVTSVPRRSRVLRLNQEKDNLVVFGKKGSQTVFTILDENMEPKVVGAEDAVSLFKASPEEQGYPVSTTFGKSFEISKERMFSKSPLPPIKGRRQESIKVLMTMRDLEPQAQSYCMDVIKIIREFDDLDEGTLYELARIDLSDPTLAFGTLKKLVPENVINTILTRASMADSQEELLLLAEEIAT